MFSRARWKPPAILAAVSIAGVVALYLVSNKPQKRRTIVGRVDPISGCRCRFTITYDWRIYSAANRQAGSRIESDVFLPAAAPAREWIEDHILHRSLVEVPVISFVASPTTPRNAAVPIVDGYPELTPVGPRRLITYRHLRIDGFPATVVSSEEGPASHRFRRTALLVYVPDHSMLYEVTGSGGAAMNREMQAIISSFHLEKVAVPAGGKR